MTEDVFIKYPNAPTGKAYIGIAKRPLMPNYNGLGFQGVVLQDEKRELVECSNCGEWFKKITNQHIKKCSEGAMDSAEYKRLFGLMKNTGLVSDVTSAKLARPLLKSNLARLVTMKKPARGCNPASKGSQNSMEWKNRIGTCPEQLKHRMKQFFVENRELPNWGNRGSGLYKAIRREHGDFFKWIESIGFPAIERHGTKYVYQFSEKEVYSFNINKIDERKMLADRILELPIFKDLIK